MSRWQSPRQRRDAHRRRRWNARDETRRARAAAEEALRKRARDDIAANPRTVTPASLLAEVYGVDTVPVLLRGGRGVAAIGDGWRVVGSLEDVRAELEHRRAG